MYTNFANYIEKTFRIDAHYFLKGGFWLTLGQFVSIFFGLITTVLFAHFLSEADYGVYRYLIGIAALLSSFSLTGLGQSILQTAAKKYYGFYKETLKLNFLYNLPITLISLIGTAYYWFNGNATLAIGCALISILQPIINTFQFIPLFLLGSKRFKESTTLQTVRVFAISIVSVIALLMTQSILILFAVYLISYLLTNLISHLIYKAEGEPTPIDIKAKYIKYAKHTSVRNIIANISQRADLILVFTQLGAVELAIYTIATIIPEQIKGSVKNLSALLLAKYANHPDPSQLRKSVPKRSLQLFTILSVITFLYILISPYVYQLIFPKYETAIFLSQLIALSLPTAVAIIPFGILQAEMKERQLYSINLIFSIGTLLLMLVLTLAFGLIGAVAAKILSRYFNLFLNYFYLYR